MWSFNSATGHYEDNIVAFADLIAPAPIDRHTAPRRAPALSTGDQRPFCRQPAQCKPEWSDGRRLMEMKRLSLSCMSSPSYTLEKASGSGDHQRVVLGAAGEVELIEVMDAPAVITETLDLLVLGGPTHAFSMTRPSTREDASGRVPPRGSTTIGLREWLEQFPLGAHTELVATFDTRVAKVRHLPGSAAKGAAKVALKLGYEVAAPAESFGVETSVARCWRASWAAPSSGRAAGSAGRSRCRRARYLVSVRFAVCGERSDANERFG